jgi:hypothetical protein
MLDAVKAAERECLAGEPLDLAVTFQILKDLAMQLDAKADNIERMFTDENSPDGQLRRAIEAAKKAHKFLQSLSWSQASGWLAVFG